MSVQKQMLKVAYLLIEKKAKPDIQDEDDNNTLHLLAMEQRIWLSKQLDQLDPFLRTLNKKEMAFLDKIYSEHKKSHSCFGYFSSFSRGRNTATILIITNNQIYKVIRNLFYQLKSIL